MATVIRKKIKKNGKTGIKYEVHFPKKKTKTAKVRMRLKSKDEPKKTGTRKATVRIRRKPKLTNKFLNLPTTLIS